MLDVDRAEEDLELKTRIALSCCAVVMCYSMSSTHIDQIVRLLPSGDEYPHRSPETLDEVGISGVNAEDEY